MELEQGQVLLLELLLELKEKLGLDLELGLGLPTLLDLTPSLNPLVSREEGECLGDAPEEVCQVWREAEEEWVEREALEAWEVWEAVEVCLVCQECLVWLLVWQELWEECLEWQVCLACLVCHLSLHTHHITSPGPSLEVLLPGVDPQWRP